MLLALTSPLGYLGRGQSFAVMSVRCGARDPKVVHETLAAVSRNLNNDTRIPID